MEEVIREDLKGALDQVKCRDCPYLSFMMEMTAARLALFKDDPEAAQLLVEVEQWHASLSEPKDKSPECRECTVDDAWREVLKRWPVECGVP